MWSCFETERSFKLIQLTLFLHNGQVDYHNQLKGITTNPQTYYNPQISTLIETLTDIHILLESWLLVQFWVIRIYACFTSAFLQSCILKDISCFCSFLVLIASLQSIQSKVFIFVFLNAEKISNS